MLDLLPGGQVEGDVRLVLQGGEGAGEGLLLQVLEDQAQDVRLFYLCEGLGCLHWLSIIYCASWQIRR